MPIRGDRFYDVPYSIASAILTSGNTAVSTSPAYYHGISIVSNITSTCKMTIFDNISTTAGNLLDLISIGTNAQTRVEKYLPIKAKNGIYVKMEGTLGDAVIFYAPEG